MRLLTALGIVALTIPMTSLAAEKAHKAVTKTKSVPPATSQPESKPAAEAAAPADMPIDTNPNLQTNVIGSKEAPTVYNIVPWKQTGEAKLTKKEVTTSVLKESLQALDPDVLQREIEFHKALQEVRP